MTPRACVTLSKAGVTLSKAGVTLSKAGVTVSEATVTLSELEGSKRFADYYNPFLLVVTWTYYGRSCSSADRLRSFVAALLRVTPRACVTMSEARCRPERSRRV